MAWKPPSPSAFPTMAGRRLDIALSCLSERPLSRSRPPRGDGKEAAFCSIEFQNFSFPTSVAKVKPPELPLLADQGRLVRSQPGFGIGTLPWPLVPWESQACPQSSQWPWRPTRMTRGAFCMSGFPAVVSLHKLVASRFGWGVSCPELALGVTLQQSSAPHPSQSEKAGGLRKTI